MSGPSGFNIPGNSPPVYPPTGFLPPSRVDFANLPVSLLDPAILAESVPPVAPAHAGHEIAPSAATLRERASALTSRYNLSPQISMALKDFAELPSISEQLMFSLALTLNALELEASDAWSISSELKARSTLSVTSIMRQLGIRSLPQEDDAHKVSAVLKLITAEICSFRNIFKKAIEASLLPDSSTANIANLTASLLRNISASGQATVRHYVRFSLLFVILEGSRQVPPELALSNIQ
ncbi:hypothetical protein MD484_g8977, partial [Candolleomyces efflorescens]